MQRKRGRRSFSKMFWVSSITAIFLALIFFIATSSLFSIKSIEIQLFRIDCSDESQIKNSANLLGHNFFLIDSTKTESVLKSNFICIKSVIVKRLFPDKLKLIILGREPIAILVNLKKEKATLSEELEGFVVASQSANFNFLADEVTENFLIDKEGAVYSNNTGLVMAQKVYVNGLNLILGQKMSNDLVNNLLMILEKINLFGVNVKEAKLISEKVFLINAIPRIIFKLDNTLDTQIASLQLILNKAKIDSSNLEFIDLRFDRPIVRLAPKK